jgi:hypothetical protein
MGAPLLLQKRDHDICSLLGFTNLYRKSCILSLICDSIYIAVKLKDDAVTRDHQSLALILVHRHHLITRHWRGLEFLENHFTASVSI